ncbi:MAG: hypothetical protein LQ342_000789 [Letrouitia transgressa]|nr:MAG: hypothetical protein LQ342_000789 [Letrouitia transgressa]
MSSQYDAIQAAYDLLREKSIACIERENVQTAIAPFITGARVLELACGSGFYTREFLPWGARAVVGVDISERMLAEARRQVAATAAAARGDVSSSSSNGNGNSDCHQVDFIRGDCGEPTLYSPGSPGGDRVRVPEPFDVVFGAWLLNYAPDREGLVRMFRNVCLNLREGGRFVSVTVPPAEDPRASIEAEQSARRPPEGSGGLNYEVRGDVEEGVFFHVHGETEAGDVDFDCYHLRKEVYEAAAREAGMNGELEWRVTSVPERYLRGEGPGGASTEELESYQIAPNYGLLVIVK